MMMIESAPIGRRHEKYANSYVFAQNRQITTAAENANWDNQQGYVTCFLAWIFEDGRFEKK